MYTVEFSNSLKHRVYPCKKNQSPDLDYLDWVFNVNQPAVKAIIYCNRNQLIRNLSVQELVFEDFCTSGSTVLPLCDEGAKHKNTILVCGICPTRRGDGDKIMTEVDKNVDVLPVTYTVTIGGWMTLNKPKMVGKFRPIKIVKSHRTTVIGYVY